MCFFPDLGSVFAGSLALCGADVEEQVQDEVSGDPEPLTGSFKSLFDAILNADRK